MFPSQIITIPLQNILSQIYVIEHWYNIYGRDEAVIANICKQEKSWQMQTNTEPPTYTLAINLSML